MQYFIANQDEFIEGDIRKFLLVNKNKKGDDQKQYLNIMAAEMYRSKFLKPISKLSVLVEVKGTVA